MPSVSWQHSLHGLWHFWARSPANVCGAEVAWRLGGPDARMQAPPPRPPANDQPPQPQPRPRPSNTPHTCRSCMRTAGGSRSTTPCRSPMIPDDASAHPPMMRRRRPHAWLAACRTTAPSWSLLPDDVLLRLVMTDQKPTTRIRVCVCVCWGMVGVCARWVGEGGPSVQAAFKLRGSGGVLRMHRVCGCHMRLFLRTASHRRKRLQTWHGLWGVPHQ